MHVLYMASPVNVILKKKPDFKIITETAANQQHKQQRQPGSRIN